MWDQTNNARQFIPYDDELPRPDPPVVGKVTHFSIELYWEKALENAMLVADKGDGRIRVCLQEQDREGEWGNLYCGYAKRQTMTGLEPQSDYRYRMRFMNNAGNSEWSPRVQVSTTKAPMNGEHLHKAILRRDKELLEQIIETGDVKIDVPDKYGFSGLMQASQKGYLEIVECLLEHGAEVDAQNDAGKTALMLACFARQLDVVKLLRKYGACYEVFDRGGSAPIHWAVDGGNTKLLEWMIKEDGANVNLADKNSGWTPLLRCASLGGKREVGVALLTNGANINAQDRDKKTSVMIAIVNNHTELLEVLLKMNANIQVKNDYGKTAYDMAMSMEKRRIIKTLTEHMEAKGIKTY